MPTFVRIASANDIASSDAAWFSGEQQARLQYRPGAEDSFLSTFWFGIWPDRSNRLAQQQLGIAGDDKITQLANRFITHPGVKAACFLVEVGHADEDVRRFAKYAPLGVFNQRLPHAPPAEFGRHAKQLDIADKCALHADHEETGPLAGHFCKITLPRTIGQ